MQVLAGDIGGTKTLLQIAELTQTNYSIHYEERFESKSWQGFIPLLEKFLNNAHHQYLPQTACFAVAGPVNGNYAQLTNLAWDDINISQIARYFDIAQIKLINDFQAVGYGIAGIQAKELAILQTGHELLHAPRIVIGAGTGLGQSILIWQDGHYYPLTSEGGHVDFAPRDFEQTQLLNFLLARYAHVSYERLLSGAGLVAIYQFMCAAKLPHNEQIFTQAAEISTAALHGSDPIAIDTLKLFVRIYGQQAGNFALTCLAHGGVYIAGGIAPRILPFFQDGEFMRAFNDKGRMNRLTVTMPVSVVLNSRVGLIGAALVASRF